MTAFKKFGTSNLEVSPIAFGGNVFGWTLDEKESFKILDTWMDWGFNFIDTADSYSKWVPGNSGGESENIIGKWLQKRGKREDVILATKVGSDLGDGKKGLTAKYISQAIEASLKRLKTDYIDIYLSHHDDLETPVGETMEAFHKLVKEGKVRNLGASNLSPERISDSNEFARENNLTPYSCVQPLYNLYDRETFETQYLPLVKQENLAVMNYYALASGFLTGKYRDESDFNKSLRGGGMKEYLNDRGTRILKAMDEVAEMHQITLAQIALAWLLQKPYITTPIASATSENQLKQMRDASQLQLSESEMKKLDNASKIF